MVVAKMIMAVRLIVNGTEPTEITGMHGINQKTRSSRPVAIPHLPAATANSIPPGDQFICLSGDVGTGVLSRFKKTYLTLR